MAFVSRYREDDEGHYRRATVAIIASKEDDKATIERLNDVISKAYSLNYIKKSGFTVLRESCDKGDFIQQRRKEFFSAIKEFKEEKAPYKYYTVISLYKKSNPLDRFTYELFDEKSVNNRSRWHR